MIFTLACAVGAIAIFICGLVAGMIFMNSVNEAKRFHEQRDFDLWNTPLPPSVRSLSPSKHLH